MKIIIESPGIKIKPALTKFVEHHVSKLETLYPQIMDAWVCLRAEPSDNQENKASDIRLSISGNDLFASKKSDSFEEAITRTVDALKSQLERNKPEYVNKMV